MGPLAPNADCSSRTAKPRGTNRKDLSPTALKVRNRQLGCNAWNSQPILEDRRVCGHHPSLEEIDARGAREQGE
jgi:hypothetical protein